MPVPVSTLASRAVALEMAVTVAPLSISIRRLTPLMEATTQKCPSGDIRTRSSLPATCWSSRPMLLREARQLRLVGRLLQQDEDQEREQGSGEAEADDASDDRDPLQKQQDDRRGDRVKREVSAIRERWSACLPK